MWLGKTLFLPSDFKTKSFEKFILWEIAARKLDFAASEQQRHRSDCDDVKTSVLLDFSLTVKAATLIFISGRGSAISSAKQGESGSIYNLVKN